jgi:hypothetical protein
MALADPSGADRAVPTGIADHRRASDDNERTQIANAAFGKQVLDVAIAQCEPQVEPDRLLDDFGREPVAAIADLGHHRWLQLKVADGKPDTDVMMPLRRHLADFVATYNFGRLLVSGLASSHAHTSL